MLALPILLGLVAPAVASADAAGDETHGARWLASLPPEQVESLERERFVLLGEPSDGPGDYEGMIQGIVLFARPRDEVLRLLIQSYRRMEYEPGLREARVVDDWADGHVVAYRTRMTLLTIEYRTVHRWDLTRGEVWWHLDPEADNDLERLEGRWKVYALDESRSVAHFGTRIDVGPSLPRIFQDLATRQKLPESLHHVRRWVDSGGSYRP